MVLVNQLLFSYFIYSKVKGFIFFYFLVGIFNIVRVKGIRSIL